MALKMDLSGIGDPIKPSVSQRVSALASEPEFEENSMDKSIVDKIHPLVIVDVINSRYNLGRLLNQMGIDTSRSNMYCPFHEDEMTGKPSAKYHADTDRLYCFSENKQYTAYHAVKYLYGLDPKVVFMDIWKDLSLEERHNYMDKYGDSGANGDADLPEDWRKYREAVLGKFERGEVTFNQHKNAVYKILCMIQEKEGDSDKDDEYRPPESEEEEEKNPNVIEDWG